MSLFDITTFAWDNLGLDEGGLPTHLPMGVTVNGEGPEDDDKAHHYECWCHDPRCPLAVALRRAHQAGLRASRREEV